LDWSASHGSPVQSRQKHQLEQVKELLIKVLPDVEDIRRTVPQRESDRPRFEFRTPYGWVPLAGISYGYQTLIAWLVDFASRMVERYPHSRDPLAEPAVCLVDEIDLHLHPKWQRDLMSFLSERFPNTQFIATAHSPLIVQAAPSINANIAVLRPEGDRVVIDNRTESVRGWRIDQILTSNLYGLPSARAKEYDELLQDREKLLSKPRLTQVDRTKLKKLDAQMKLLPQGETASQARELLELAKTTSELIKTHQGRKK
jgi:predicted ATP-binding protein involved in virulence